MKKTIHDGDRDFLSLLKKWLAGDFRRGDERTMGPLLTADDFRREAFEGFETLADGDEKAALERIRRRLADRVRPEAAARTVGLKKRRIWLAAAASMAVLVVAAMWAVDHFSDEKKALAPVAQNLPEPTQPIDNQAVTSNSDAVLNESRAAEKAFEKAEKVIQNTPSRAAAPTISEDKKAVSKTEEIAQPAAADEAFSADFAVEKDDLEKAKKPAPAAPKKAESETLRQPSYANSKPDFAQNAGFIYYGKVTDATSGGPVAGANVALPGLQFGTMTDRDGDFQVAASTPAGVDVVVTAPGYLNKTAKIEGKTVKNIALEADRDRLAEVVVAAPTKSKKRKDAREIPGGPAPKMGWPAFEGFARANLRMPEKAKSAGIRGSVTLEFFVDSKGQPTQIFVLESLGYGCDEEAIRLLEASGDWSGLQKEAAISIRFEN